MTTSALSTKNFGINDPKISDAEVADRLIQNIPKGTYSWIRVTTIESHNFHYLVAKRSREIHLQPTTLECLLHIIQSIGSTLKTINGNRAVNAILSTSLDGDERKDIDELKKAVQRNCQFLIYVSTDLSCIDFQIIDSLATNMIMKIPCTIL